MVAHLLCKQGVRGSSPRASTEKKVPATAAGTFCFNLCPGLPLPDSDGDIKKARRRGCPRGTDAGHNLRE